MSAEAMKLSTSLSFVITGAAGGAVAVKALA
jgi:hypothetical protein